MLSEHIQVEGQKINHYFHLICLNKNKLLWLKHNFGKCWEMLRSIIVFHLLEPHFFSEHSAKHKMENTRNFSPGKLSNFRLTLGPETSARHPRPWALKCQSSDSEQPLLSVRGAGREGQQPPLEPYKSSPQGVKAMRMGQFVHQGLEESSAGAHPARKGAQLWYPPGGEPSAPTRKDGVTQRELPWKRAATHPGLGCRECQSLAWVAWQQGQQQGEGWPGDGLLSWWQSCRRR